MSDQGALFDADQRQPWQRSSLEVPAEQLARQSDPATSKIAALQLTRAGSMRRRLLEAFRDQPLGLTPEEAALWAGFSAADGAWKRVSDLKTAGLITPTGDLRSSSRGRLQEVQRITMLGREALL